MKFTPIDPPREFDVGGHITLKDCGRVALEPDEMVTFVAPSGSEYDVTRKSWGYYATPSLNKRLKRFGLRGALVRNAGNACFVMLVEAGKEDDFWAYVESEALTFIAWLDDDATLRRIEEAVSDDG